VVVLAALAFPTGAAAGGNYSTAHFKETKNVFAYGQAPVFMPNGKQVVFGEDVGTGLHNQVYMANWPTGSDFHCLTCTGPDSSKDNVNGVPAVRPGGDWILFHSWRGRNITFGSPGYGGIGSALWVMHPNGSDQTQLTETQKGFGAQEGWDDYHAYWSPNGKMVEWAHFDGNIPTGGIGYWDVEVGTFVVKDGVPSLTDIHAVLPANGRWYETQWWAPDGSGFLYTMTSNGMDIPHLYFCKLIDHDKTCDSTQYTFGPSWDEQALFTPDMKNIIFMSSRAQPGLFNTWAGAAQELGIPDTIDWIGILPLFELGYLQPVAQEATDLYELNVATRSVRRLTDDGPGGWVTPEFTWNPTKKFLMWTESRFPDGLRYSFAPNISNYLTQLGDFLKDPTLPTTDINANGAGVPAIPVQRQTMVGVFEFGSHRH
jgi:Tol biopolymer transport system component